MSPVYTRDWTPPDCEMFGSIFTLAGALALDGCAATIVEADGKCDARSETSSATGIGQWMGTGNPPMYFGGRLTRAQVIAKGLTWQIERLAERYAPRTGKLGSLKRVYGVIAAPDAVDRELADDVPIYDGAYLEDGRLAEPLRNDRKQFVRTGKGALVFPPGAKVRRTRYGDTTAAFYSNPRWRLLGGPITLASIGLSARVHASSPRFYELVQRVTGAPVPWLNLWQREVRADVAGLITRVDVQEYQRAKGLVPDGEVGPKAIAALVLDYDVGSLGS